MHFTKEGTNSGPVRHVIGEGVHKPAFDYHQHLSVFPVLWQRIKLWLFYEERLIWIQKNYMKNWSKLGNMITNAFISALSLKNETSKIHALWVTEVANMNFWKRNTARVVIFVKFYCTMDQKYRLCFDCSAGKTESDKK